MRIAVCDDNEDFLNSIRQQLEKLEMVSHIALFSSRKKLLEAVRRGEVYDGVLMDIDLKDEKNGMDAAEELYRMNSGTRIVYVTGYNDRFSQQILFYKANLSGYLTKPVNIELLKANLLKITREMEREKSEKQVLSLKLGTTVTTVPCREIIFMESRNHIVNVYTEKETIRTYTSLRNLLEKLPESFCQCHKSFAVNMGQIRRFEAGSILMKNGAKVPVSRSCYGKAREDYFQFVKGLF